MTDLSSIDRELLSEIINSETGELNLYRLHEKFRLSPGQILSSVLKFKERNILEMIDEMNVRLTDTGRGWLIDNRRSLFLQERNRYWREVPEDMLQEKITFDDVIMLTRKRFGSDIYRLIEGG